MSGSRGIIDEVRRVRGAIRWPDAFTRTSAGPGAWHNALLLWVPGMSRGTYRGYLSGSSVWQTFADGGIESRLAYGWAGNSSNQVTGYAAMRFLCHLYDIEPPARRLKHEPFVPDPDILVRVVWAQSMEIPPESLTVDADTFWVKLASAHER